MSANSPRKQPNQLTLQSSGFALAVRNGLSCKRKSIPSKYLYDQTGSNIFVKITQTQAYYPTQCELEIFQQQAEHIIESVPVNTNQVIELGSGDGSKTKHLLQAFSLRFPSINYMPVDICPESLTLIQENLNNHLSISITPKEADYFSFLQKPEKNNQPTNRLLLFLGSNLGNFSYDESIYFLKLLYRFMEPGDTLLLGLDLKKDINTLNLAYNDPEGYTKDFNMNLLTRINRELGGNFDERLFAHHSYYNAEIGAMQSYLVAKQKHEVYIESLDLHCQFDAYEGLHLESSFKYTMADIDSLAQKTGFQHLKHFTDSKQYYIDSLWQKPHTDATMA